jgi:hypothetical protein
LVATAHAEVDPASTLAADALCATARMDIRAVSLLSNRIRSGELPGLRRIELWR